MREIIFRGKRIDDNKWICGYYFKSWDKGFILWGTVNGVPNRVQVIPETVGQFTGLPSQDKQDIYEGDRLFDYDDDYYVVEFSEGRFVAVGDGFEIDLFEIADRCSVIGNIHDNKEIK